MLVRLFALCLLLPGVAAFAGEPGKTAYDYEFTAIEGQPLPLSTYRGKVVLVVNTASLCGYTPQYAGLQKVWEKYRDRGFILLGVPSNDFGSQEPGSDKEIKQFCDLNYGIDFPMTTKVHVRGRNAHPFYGWAAQQLGAQSRPRWNFHKYLVGRDGRLVGWFPSAVEPGSADLVRAIEAALGRKATAGG